MTTLSNIPAALNWKIYKGDTAKLTILMQDELGNDVNLDDYTFTGKVKAQPDDTLAIQDLAIVAGSTILSIEILDTETLPKISYFDIQSVKDGVTWTILKGTINVEQDVTN